MPTHKWDDDGAEEQVCGVVVEMDRFLSRGGLVYFGISPHTVVEPGRGWCDHWIVCFPLLLANELVSFSTVEKNLNALMHCRAHSRSTTTTRRSGFGKPRSGRMVSIEHRRGIACSAYNERFSLVVVVSCHRLPAFYHPWMHRVGEWVVVRGPRRWWSYIICRQTDILTSVILSSRQTFE